MAQNSENLGGLAGVSPRSPRLQQTQGVCGIPESEGTSQLKQERQREAFLADEYPNQEFRLPLIETVTEKITSI